MAQVRNRYKASFKLKVAREALREEVSLADLSSVYGVHVSVIARSKREALQSIEDGFFGKLERQQVDMEAETDMLHAKIGKLTVERDFLLKISERLGLGGERLLHP